MAAEPRIDLRNASNRHIAIVILSNAGHVITNARICEAFRDFTFRINHHESQSKFCSVRCLFGQLPASWWLKRLSESVSLHALRSGKRWNLLAGVRLWLPYELHLKQLPVFVPLLELIFSNFSRDYTPTLHRRCDQVTAQRQKRWLKGLIIFGP